MPSKTGSSKMLTLPEVCEELHVSRSTFYDWRQKGRAPRCIKLPTATCASDGATWTTGSTTTRTPLDGDHVQRQGLEDRGRTRVREAPRTPCGGPSTATERRAPFATRALADAFRSELVSATRHGEAFSLSTGRPVSHRSGADGGELVRLRGPVRGRPVARTSANNRKNIAKALTATTIALLRTPPARFKPVEVRTALREFAFNTKRREEAPPEVSVILRWVERNTLSMAAWEDRPSGRQRVAALRCPAGRTRPRPARSSDRRILNVAMEHAVKHRMLRDEPPAQGRGTAPRTLSAVDKRSLLNAGQRPSLLGWVAAALAAALGCTRSSPRSTTPARAPRKPWRCALRTFTCRSGR